MVAIAVAALSRITAIACFALIDGKFLFVYFTFLSDRPLIGRL
jgi:hypothetical protein